MKCPFGDIDLSAAPRAGYVHVPFCGRRCGYCNFTLVARRDDLIPRYLQAVEMELAALGEPREVDTLFFGGGTPTHLNCDELGHVLRLAKKWFPLSACGEFSVEANPRDVTPEKVALLAEHGVTRLSIGAQSLAADKLRVLERDHSPDDVRRAVEKAKARMKSVGLDLIFAAPEETPVEWLADLQAALALQPDHVSTYGLTFEKGTSFWSERLRGKLAECADDTQGTMYEAAIDTLTAAGYEHYEVSNFARPGHRCQHNEAYWLGREYYAVGPGAARYVAGRREVNHRSTTTYINRVLAGGSPVAESECLAPDGRVRERFVFGMRRLEGVSHERFRAATGQGLHEFFPVLRRHVNAGLIGDDSERIRLTRQGLLVSDALWPDYLQ